MDKKPNIEVVDPKARLLTLKADEVTPQPIHWLWPNRIALGKLVIIAGDPGLGKSQLTLDIAARVTRAAKWPVDNTTAPLGDVLIITGEDDPADTVIPRLIAAGADLTRVRVSESVVDYDIQGEAHERTMALGKDLDLIEKEITPDCKLIIVDPVTAFSAGIDTHKNSDVRELLAPLGRLAQRCGVTVIGVSHLNKSGQGAITRVTGSIGWVAAARAAYIVGKDKNDPKRRIFTPIKNNLGDDETGFAFSIGSSPSGIPYVVWEDDLVRIQADEVLSGVDEQRTQREEAKDFLEDLLKPGPIESKEVFRAARQAGFSDSTIRRAKSELDIYVGKREFQGGWFWSRHPLAGAKVIKFPGDENVSTFEDVDHLRELDPLTNRLSEATHELNVTVEQAKSLFSEADLLMLSSGEMTIETARHFLSTCIEDGQI